MTRFCIQATWNDVPHLSKAQKASLWDAIPDYQRDARSKGIPVLGSGRVFVAPEEKIACEPFEVPRSFARITGIDFGIDHPFAAARCGPRKTYPGFNGAMQPWDCLGADAGSA